MTLCQENYCVGVVLTRPRLQIELLLMQRLLIQFQQTSCKRIIFCFFAGKPCFLIVTGETCSFVFLFVSCYHQAYFGSFTVASPKMAFYQEGSPLFKDWCGYDGYEQTRHSAWCCCKLEKTLKAFGCAYNLPYQSIIIVSPIVRWLGICNFFLGPWLSQEWLDLTANRLAPAPLPALTADDALLIIAT